MWTLPALAEERGDRRAFRRHLGRGRLEPTIQHRAHALARGHPTIPQEIYSRVISDALGAGPELGERLVGRGKNDQRQSRDRDRETGISRRCLLPADGFYEWTRTVRAKQPYCFEVKDGELFAFAGLWERWQDAGGKVLETCSILTTVPNVVTSTVPGRMPVILEPESYEIWLHPGMGDVGTVYETLKPCDARLMRCFPVSSRINSVVHDDAAGSARVDEMQNSLFS